MKNKKRLVVVLSVALLLVVAVYCVHTDGPYKGKVVELETGKPIEGAVVAATWSITKWNNTANFCDAEETVTDKNGEFVLPKGWCIRGPISELNWAQVVVFKPGYLGYPPISSTYEASLFTGYEFRDKNKYDIIRLVKSKTRKDRELTYGSASLLPYD